MDIALGIGFGLGLAGLGAGVGMGIAVNGALGGIARQPEAGNRISTQMLIGLAFMEVIVIFAFVMGILLSGKMTGEAPKSAMNTTKSAVHSDVALNNTGNVLATR